MEEILRLGRTKGREYSGLDDRLRNFRRLSEDLGVPKETVLAVYAKKHWDGIMTFIKDSRTQDVTSIDYRKNLSEPIEGRINDLLTYLILLKCMLVESYEHTPVATSRTNATPENIQKAIEREIIAGMDA